MTGRDGGSHPRPGIGSPTQELTAGHSMGTVQPHLEKGIGARRWGQIQDGLFRAAEGHGGAARLQWNTPNQANLWWNSKAAGIEAGTTKGVALLNVALLKIELALCSLKMSSSGPALTGKGPRGCSRKQAWCACTGAR